MKFEGLLFLSAVIAFTVAAPSGGKGRNVEDLTLDAVGKIINFARNRNAQLPSSLNELANLEGIDDITYNVPDNLFRTKSLNDRITRPRSPTGRKLNRLTAVSQDDSLQDADTKTAITESLAEKESLRNAYTIGKHLYNAYRAYQNGVATKEDLQSINEDIDRVIQQMNAVMVREDSSKDDRVEEEALYTVPALLYKAYQGYKLYKDLTG